MSIYFLLFVTVIYKFLNFQLDTKTKQLIHKGQSVHLTQQNFLLLEIFIKNSGRLVEKETLIDHVWHGRVVQDNTIDQGISKLRKLLNSYDAAEYISAGYGKGWQFLPETQALTSPATKTTKAHHPWLTVTAIVMISLVWMFWPNTNVEVQAKTQSMVMFIPTEEKNPNQWWSASSASIIENFLGQSHNNIIKKYQADERKIDPKEYISNLHHLSPELIVITTDLTKNSLSNDYQLTLNVRSKEHNNTEHTITGTELNQVYGEVGDWLTAQYGLDTVESNILPNNPLAVQLFMQGISNLESGDLDKSVNYFILSLQEMPDFDLARLKLAESLKKTNQFDAAMSHLNTLQLSNQELNIQLKVIALKGDIFEIQGKHEHAKNLYEVTLAQYAHLNHPALYEIRFFLSDVYFSLADNQKGLEQLNHIEQHIDKQASPYLLADTYREQGQIHFINGQFDLANSYTQKALKLYTDLGYLVGQIKAYASLSRFYQQQHQYQKAIGYINKALALSRTTENKLLIGASVNQLIYLLNTQGRASEAWELTLEMEHIGLELGYSRMVVAAKHHFAELARHQRKFTLAETNLDEHLKLAKESNNKRAIHTNNLLRIDFLLDQKITAGVQELIDQVHQHIIDTGEVRLESVMSLNQAQLNKLLGQTTHLIPLLETGLQQAKETEDSETIIRINQLIDRLI